MGQSCVPFLCTYGDSLAQGTARSSHREHPCSPLQPPAAGSATSKHPTPPTPLIQPPSYLPCLLKALLVCAVNDINLPGGTKGTVGSPSLPLPAAGASLRHGSGTHQQVGAAQVLPPVGADGALPPDVPDVQLEAVRVDALDVEPLCGESNSGVTQGPASRGPASRGPQQPLPGWG